MKKGEAAVKKGEAAVKKGEAAVKKRLLDCEHGDIVSLPGYGRVRLCGKPFLIDHRGPLGGDHKQGVRYNFTFSDCAAMGWGDPGTEVEVHTRAASKS